MDIAGDAVGHGHSKTFLLKSHAFMGPHFTSALTQIYFKITSLNTNKQLILAYRI